ncbi:uncharacterized protein At5g23160 [Corylus avellana]|uniref:uncharacterized protein At5g23160 n=1 Tax=Corylus avellana TaxID=13451 RepID=UPI001E213AC7|nr:uncharacterized protein At5g23160 [Corylus avellana]
MAKTQKKTHQTKSPTTHFLRCCFGYSSGDSDQRPDEITRSDGQKKKTRWRWYSPSKFCMKNSGAKTVPVEATLSEKANLKNKLPASKSKSKSKSDKLTASKPRAWVTNHQLPSRIPVVVPVASDQAAQEKREETAYGPTQNIILEKRDRVNHASKDDTCQKRCSFGRKIEAIRAGCSQPGSPEPKPKPTRPAAISHSAPLLETKRVANPSSTIARGTVKKSARKIDGSAEKLDPLVGLSIIMVTLIIMLFWGRICAILCTSAWFYFVPRLRNVTKSDDVVEKNPNSLDQDYDSEEYKKKVVLEGFLERNHRIG